jgi:hypothetical protein
MIKVIKIILPRVSGNKADSTNADDDTGYSMRKCVIKKLRSFNMDKIF